MAGPRTPLALLLAIVLAVAGCGVGSRTYSTSFAEQDEVGSMRIEALPIDVIDLTGLVTGVEAIEHDGPVAGVGGIVPVSAQANTVRLGWTGGACDARVRVVFSRTDRGYALRVMPETSLVGKLGCAALGVPRAIAITVRESLEGQRIGATLDGT